MMNRDDTIEAFACCTQIPPDCENCPEKGPTGELGRGCKSDVKTSVYHWLVVQEPVVRCSECKYAHMTYDGECKYCDFWQEDGGDALYLDKGFYCAAGERRDGDANG